MQLPLLIIAVALFGEAPGAEPTPLEAPAWSVVTLLPGEGLRDVAARFQVEERALRGWNPGLPEVPSWGTRVRVRSLHREEERFRMNWRAKQRVSLRWLARRFELPEHQLRLLNKWRRSKRNLEEGERARVYVKRSMWPGGYLDGGIQLADGPGIKVKHPQWAWGRPVTVRSLEALGAALAEAFPDSLVVVGDLSKKGGGSFPPHKSHREGYDVDLGLFRLGEPWKLRFTHVTPEELDAQRTWWLIRYLMKTGRVTRVLVDWSLQAPLYEEARRLGATEAELAEWFQYPRKRWKSEGLIRHYKGHKHHLHVRFAEADGEAVL